MRTNQDQAVAAVADFTRLATVLREIEATQLAIQPLAQKLDGLLRERRRLESRSFIAVNKIKSAEVESSSGPDKPWFGTVYEFGKWLKAQPSVKPWAEWNGIIHHAADLMAGRIPDMPGCTTDLSE